MKISIITATYNSKTTLQDALASIESQKEVNIEYIIIDGGSTDGTLDLIKNNDTIAKYISEPDKGIYDALNKGIQLATGDIIGFLHSDDLFASNSVVAQIVKEFENVVIDGVYGDLEYVDKENTKRVIRHWKSEPFQPKLLKQGWMPAHPTLFLRTEVYEKHGLFNLSYKIAADYDFMLRILKDKTLQFSYLPQVITRMRVGGASNRSLKNIIQKTKEDYKVVTSNGVGGWLTIVIKNKSKIKQFF
jgi:glycosyltransferase involved in cell wall biosynthesis